MSEIWLTLTADHHRAVTWPFKIGIFLAINFIIVFTLALPKPDGSPGVFWKLFKR